MKKTLSLLLALMMLLSCFGALAEENPDAEIPADSANRWEESRLPALPWTAT